MTRRFDPLALVAGLVFVAIAAVGLTDRIQLTVTDVRWIAPILLVIFGILLLVTAANGNRRTDADDGHVREPASVGGGASTSDEVPDAQPDTQPDAQPDTPPAATDPTAPQRPAEDR